MPIRFDAQTDGARLDSPNVINYNAAYTVMLWFYVVNTYGVTFPADGTDQALFTFNTDANFNYDKFSLYRNTGANMQVAGVVIPASGGESNFYGSAPTAQVWHHLAIVRLSDTQIACYIDGVQLGSTWTHTSVTGRIAATHFEIGNLGSAIGGSTVVGKFYRFHSVKQWSRALTAEQITSERLVNRPLLWTNLEGWWPTLPGASYRLLDQSGKGRDFIASGTLADEAGPSLAWGLPILAVPIPSLIVPSSATFNGIATFTPGTPALTSFSSITFAAAATFASGTPNLVAPSVSFTAIATLVPGSPKLVAPAISSDGIATFIPGAPKLIASAVTFAGIGALTLGASVLPSSATFTAVGTLAASNPVLPSAASFAGAATLTATPILVSSASFAGTGLLNPGTPAINISASFASAGVGTLSAINPILTTNTSFAGAATFNPGAPILPTSATSAGTSSLTINSVILTAPSVVTHGVGTLSATYSYNGPVGVVFDGVSTLVATPLLLMPTGVNFVATASLAANGYLTIPSSAAFAGAASASFDARLLTFSSGAFAGSSAFNSSPIQLIYSFVSIAGISDLETNPFVNLFSIASFVGIGTLVVLTGPVPDVAAIGASDIQSRTYMRIGVKPANLGISSLNIVES